MNHVDIIYFIGLDDLGYWNLSLRHDELIPVYFHGHDVSVDDRRSEGKFMDFSRSHAGLCIALVPFGIKVVISGNPPAAKNVVQAIVGVLALMALLYFFGQAG